MDGNRSLRPICLFTGNYAIKGESSDIESPVLNHWCDFSPRPYFYTQRLSVYRIRRTENSAIGIRRTVFISSAVVVRAMDFVFMDNYYLPHRTDLWQNLSSGVFFCCC
jgi:hypothetical protein